MTNLRPLILVAVLVSDCALAQTKLVVAQHVYRSPDGKLIAQVTSVNKAHESRVEVHRSNGKLLLVQDYSSADMEHGQVVCKAAWSPDSSFFVFATSNTGGHSPQARPTFSYSREQNRIYDLDRFLGYITDCDFTLRAPNRIITKSNGETVQAALGSVIK
jgi:Tol biopolymer transport system component